MVRSCPRCGEPALSDQPLCADCEADKASDHRHLLWVLSILAAVMLLLAALAIATILFG